MKYGFSILLAAMMFATAATAQVALLNEAELNDIDKNNDGFLSKDEFNAFSDYAFQAMDEDKNGQIGLEEAKPFLDIKQFQDTDRDNDNSISRSEFDIQMNSDFEGADKDGNGQLD
ncbi:MAG: hypothetical protein ACR2O2_05135 [Ruegeria sp.]